MKSSRRHTANDAQVNIPLTSLSAHEQWEQDDIDEDGIVPNTPSRSASTSSADRAAEQHTILHQLTTQFARLWRLIPSSWRVERNPDVALRHITTVCGFISLCIFVFSIPWLLYLVAPRAPTPPGTSPNLDEAASMISGHNGAVAADHPLCSQLGVDIMRDQQGNSVDAMVATMLCQGILSPFASGIGGGAFILVYDEKRMQATFYDAREVAPYAANMSLYERNSTSPKFGGLAVAVPGELRGLYDAHREYGNLKWSEVVNPAIEIGESAKVGAFLAVKLKQMNETILASPTLSKLFTKQVATKKRQAESDAAAAVELPGVRRGVMDSLNDGSTVGDANDKDEHGVTPKKGGGEENGTYTTQLLEEGDKMVNDRLLETLRQVAKSGPDAFYIGLAGNISREVRQAGGVMSVKDITSYTVMQRRPLFSYYQGFQIVGAPLPSTGGASIGMALNMITALQFRSKGRNGLTYNLLIETLKWVFAERMGLGDPLFVPAAQRQVNAMLSRREALNRVYRIDDSRTFKPEHYSDKISTSKLEGGTSHVSILDKNGLAVSVTSTINLPFGAGLVSESSGAILNDQMDAFSTDLTRVNAFGLYPSKENQVQGGKRALSSMCPTMVLKGASPYLILGSSGGPKAISGVLQTLLNVLDFGDWLGDAISAPRVHHQLVPNVVSIESANGSSCERTQGLRQGVELGGEDWSYWNSVCERLQQNGHQLEGPGVHGAVQAIIAPDALLSRRQRARSSADGSVGAELFGKIYAASDPRRVGKAAAY